ncbi:MAG: TrkA family potassium uptake protein [Candidatus Omnitrophota bacterium]
MKHYIIIGMDKFGYNLALALAQRQHKVTVIDKDEKKIQDISDKVSVAVIADARDEKVLAKLVEDFADAVIVSLGSDIASSVLAVLNLQSLGIKDIIAKAINKNHGRILELTGATEVIYPQRDRAIALAIKLTTKNLIEHIPMADEYSIVEIAIPENLIGKKLSELKLRNKYGVEIIAIKDVLHDEFYLVPEPSYVIKADSAFVVIGKAVNIEKLKL